MCIDIYNSIKMTKYTNIKNNELMKRLVNGDKDLQKQMSTRMVIRLNLIEIIGLRSRGIKLKDIAALYLANDKPLNVKTLSQYLWGTAQASDKKCKSWCDYCARGQCCVGTIS